MKSNENDPAFPSDAACSSWQCRKPSAGLTAREHAAIHLRVPMSGNPWLDAMITEARRWDAAQAVTAAAMTQAYGLGTLSIEQQTELMEDLAEISDRTANAITCQMKGEQP